MSNVKIKVHNVMHNDVDFSANEVEEHISRMLTDRKVDSVRIASGKQNSPLYISIDSSVHNMSFESAKLIARQALKYFSDKVEGINVTETISDRNLRIIID